MTVKVRRASLSDRQALSDIYAGRYPQQPLNPERLDFAAHDYLLAFTDDTPAGYLELSRSNREGDPAGKVWTYLTLVHEENAVIRALYKSLETLPDVQVVFTMISENQKQRQQTLLRLGYREMLRSYGAVLEVETFDLSAFGNLEAALEQGSVRIYTLADLREDPEHANKLYTLYRQTNRDVPEVGHSDTLDREAFGAHLMRDDALPEAYHVAVHEGTYIGYSELFRRSATELAQETTAVLSSHRRQGIALALKLCGLEYAKRYGYTHINTGMASNNVAMIALNTRLGFRLQKAYITFSKDLF